MWKPISPRKYCKDYNPIQALVSPLNLLPKRFLCPGRKPNSTGVNGKPISCHPIDPITPRFPTGRNTQLRVAARTENGESGGPSGITSGCAKGSPRHPCPNTYRTARVLGSPTCSRSSKPPIGIHALTSCSANEQHGRHIWGPTRSPETTNCGPHLPTATQPVHKSQSAPAAKAVGCWTTTPKFRRNPPVRMALPTRKKMRTRIVIMFPPSEHCPPPPEGDLELHTPTHLPGPHSTTSFDDFIRERMSTNKPSNTTRMFFVNVHGLQFGSLGGEFIEVCFQMDEANIDILGLAETKLDSQKRNVVATCAHAARRIFSFSQILLSSRTITYNSHFKPGGPLF
jgi:hypothetical protein